MLNLSNLPSKPGVYIFRDKSGSTLYVGKALNLKNRVRSYFTKGLELGPKTALMVSKIAKIEHIIVESEIEALLLEIDLIKRLKPKYNQQWKDDKNYKYIKISKIKNQKAKPNSNLKNYRPEDFAKVTTSRTANDKDLYFGPFPEGKTVRDVLRTLRRIFPFRDCSESKFKRYQKLGQSCLCGDLELCPAPCVGRISKKDYQKIINQLKRFLSGKSRSVIQELGKEMKSYSKSKEFEKAALIRDRIRNYEYVTQSFRQATEYLEHPNLLEDQRRRELLELSKIVNRQSSIERVEAYDISDISGQWAVGSMVVFIDGEPSKKDYRRFKVKTIDQADDVGMIKEVLRRRFKKSQILNLKTGRTKDESFETLPDLVLIDGGKPQVSAVNEVLRELGFKILVLGLAKKFEEVVRSDLAVVKLPNTSPVLHLLQRIRDEAHRFALSYHRKLRGKISMA